jgi:ATP-binding cassette subfamily F protein 3
MLTISQISKGFGQKTLFTDISLRVLAGERYGLVGPNGAGKTTLFTIILGDGEPDSGEIELERGIQIGFLPQETAPAGDETVAELAASIDPELTEIYKVLREHDDPDTPERIDAMERFVELDGYSLEAKAKRILAGLAFRPEDYNVPAHIEWRLDYAGAFGSFARHGARSLDARRADQSFGFGDLGLVPGST